MRFTHMTPQPEGILQRHNHYSMPPPRSAVLLSATMSSLKSGHYWTQLRTVLTGGQWTAPQPARAPNGTPLPWPEFLRKFDKHCVGFKDISQIASQTQALSLLLGANYLNPEAYDSREGAGGPLTLGDECILPQERIEEATAGYDTLSNLESSNFDSLNFALAYYSYALGRPADCLAQLERIPDMCDIQSHIPTPASTTKPTLQIPDASTSSWAGSFVSTDTASSISDIRDGRAWSITEAIRGLCLQGMAHEKLSPDEPDKALKSYSLALPLLVIVESEIASSPAGPTSFSHLRELWRWVVRLTDRAIVLSAMHGPVSDAALWTWLTHYLACSIHWPATFSTHLRSTISVIHLRALVIRGRQKGGNTLAWITTARTVVHEYRAILAASTVFPKAGEHNVKVEEFVDLCVAIWETGGSVGEQTGWVTDVLWWATRLTFNSYRILRHMSRLSYVAGDAELARRTLRLYVQVVGKAWEASGAGNGKLASTEEDEDFGVVGGEDDVGKDGAVNADVREKGDVPPGIDVDTDSDRQWVVTLVQGARMMCRFASASPGLDGIVDAREAGVMIEKAKVRLDKNVELIAAVDLAEGIWNGVMALKSQETRKRPEHLARSHALIARAVEGFPTPSSRYHLALVLSRPGPTQDLEEAIGNISLALEGEPTEIRYWHLLGLLLAATEQWKPAKGALETGAEIGESADTSTEGTPGDGVSIQGDGVTARDFVSTEQPVDGLPIDGLEELPSVYVLQKDSPLLPCSSSLLQPIPDRPASSSEDLFEHALQLRMSQVTLAELVEGPEGAVDKWVEVFSWIAGKKGTSRRRLSVNAGRLSMDMRPPSLPPVDVAVMNGLPSMNADLTTSISVTPATPTSEHPESTIKRSSSLDRDPTSRGKNIQQSIKARVHKGQAKITTISKKIGRSGSTTLRRTNSTPDFQSALQPKHYQASSIHSRRRLGAIMGPANLSHSHLQSATDAVPPPLTTKSDKTNKRMAKSDRLLSDLWLMSAATFRRLGKVEQAKGAIQEAEVRDEGNPSIWVQLGLYYNTLGHQHHAIDAFHKALFIAPDDVSATVHLCRSYLSPIDDKVDSSNVDLAAGMLSHLTRGAGWDVPEAWYFLAKAYGLQGRKDRERECLSFALGLSESRGVRDVGSAVGWCL